MALAAQSPPPNKDRRWCSHLPLDVVLEQLLVHAVELSTADVVEVVGDVAGVLLGTGAVRALEFPVPILVVKVPWGTPRSAQSPWGLPCQMGVDSCTNTSLFLRIPWKPAVEHPHPTSLILLLSASATEEPGTLLCKDNWAAQLMHKGPTLNLHQC